MNKELRTLAARQLDVGAHAGFVVSSKFFSLVGLDTPSSRLTIFLFTLRIVRFYEICEMFERKC